MSDTDVRKGPHLGDLAQPEATAPAGRLIQFRRQLAGLSYEAQLEAVRPAGDSEPIQMLADDGVAVQLAGGGGSGRPDSLSDIATPNLDALAQLEGEAVYERYISGFNTYNAQSKAKNKQDKRTYLEGRAARKLGRSAERETIAAFSAATGVSVSKNNKLIEILSGRGEVLRERIPDFFNRSSAVGDVKIVAQQSYDAQLRDTYRISRADNVRVKGESSKLTNEVPFYVIVSAPCDRYPTGTRVYDTVFTATEDTGGGVWEVWDE